MFLKTKLLYHLVSLLPFVLKLPILDIVILLLVLLTIEPPALELLVLKVLVLVAA